MVVHVAGPVRKGSRQIVQRCIRCGHALVMENAQIGGDVGFEQGELVDERGKSVDARFHRLPTLQICAIKSRNKRRIVLN